MAVVDGRWPPLVATMKNALSSRMKIRVGMCPEGLFTMLFLLSELTASVDMHKTDIGGRRLHPVESPECQRSLRFRYRRCSLHKHPEPGLAAPCVCNCSRERKGTARLMRYNKVAVAFSDRPIVFGRDHFQVGGFNFGSK
jgi:hypothetical protein